MDRRSFMQLFSAGATIIPLANSSIAATLVEPAKVELAEARKVEIISSAALRNLEEGQMRITVDLQKPHKSFEYASKSFMLWVDTEHGVIQLRDNVVSPGRSAGFHVDLINMTQNNSPLI